jgi:CTP synthase
MAENQENRKTNPKYIFVVGGVMSGIGKGVSTASIGRILKSKGFNVTAIKIDPYINVDAGTMNPTEHGEVFVLEDGYETDQDMGNYERFLDVTLPSINYMTTGSVYLEVIKRERNLEYKGKNVEVVPDIPLEVLRRIEAAREKAGADVTLIEIGGTIGEYQNIIFLEAARMQKQRKPHDVAVVMLSYVPIPGNIGEMKTKPTQYASRSLNSVGLQADVILARALVSLDEKRKEKIAIFCNIPKEHVISAPDVKSIYDVPLNFERDGLGAILCNILGLPDSPADLSDWKALVDASHKADKEVNIAVVGKYFDTGDYVLADSYISVLESLKHASYPAGVMPKLSYLDSEDFETGALKLDELKKYDGVVVPGGFGSRGVEGIVMAIQYARENKIPYLGLCYGMQWMTVEYARNVAGLAGANTAEVDKDAPHVVIDVMPDQKDKLIKNDFGGTMRLGVYPCEIRPGTVAHEAYFATNNAQQATNNQISERHRHRYEVNPVYVDQIEKAGLVFSGKSPDGRLCEIAELPRVQHPFFLGTQFHPEFLSHPLNPHPLFVEFIRAVSERNKN